MDENDMIVLPPLKKKNKKLQKIITKLKSIFPKKYTKLEKNNHEDNKTKELPTPVYPKY